MELTFSELRKRDVINIADGRCLGRVNDLKLCFPDGVLTAIGVPGKKRGIFSIFDKSQVFIGVNAILKIGGDVILVDLRKNGKPQLDEPCPKPKRPPQNCPPQNFQPHSCAPQRRSDNGREDYSANDFINNFSSTTDDVDY